MKYTIYVYICDIPHITMLFCSIPGKSLLDLNADDKIKSGDIQNMTVTTLSR